MYVIECSPPIMETHIHRYEAKGEAIEAAKTIAKKHNVQVEVLKVIMRFSVTIIEEEIS